MGKKPEQKLWDDLSPIFHRWGLDPVRVENGLDFGTPDVNYSKGWIELKSVTAPAWPATPVDIGWQKGQKGWLGRRWVAGGLAFLLMKIQDQYLLLDGWTCCTLDGNEPRSRPMRRMFISNSSRFWKFSSSFSGAESATKTMPSTPLSTATRVRS